ncbi:hypothetical protein [Parasphingorhabdus sp.]|uniref:hypothetical protein n=1 Tax=Parasphingorhabdus sp. TaxID=2709688 RepID=UPI003A8F1003
MIKNISLISGLIAAFALLYFVVFFVFVEPLLSDDNFDYWSMRIAIFGIFLSIVGFGVTISQLVRAASSARAAEAAIGKLKGELASFDVSGQLREGRIIAEQTKTGLLGKNWQYGLSNCERVRTILAALAVTRQHLKSTQREEAKDHLAIVQDACQNLESKITDDSFDFDVTVLNSKLRDIEVFLLNLESGIRDKAGVDS